MIDLDKKDFMNWHVYGLKPDDFDYTFYLHKNICDGRIEPLRRAYHNDRSENRDDQFDDLFYNAHIENMYVWAACLWRLQGLFEGMIRLRYLKIGRAWATYSFLLERVEKKGFLFQKDEKSELKKWADLRNALSHYPPEQWRPAMIGESEIREYLQLVQGIALRWEGHRSENPS